MVTKHPMVNIGLVLDQNLHSTLVNSRSWEKVKSIWCSPKINSDPFDWIFGLTNLEELNFQLVHWNQIPRFGSLSSLKRLVVGHCNKDWNISDLHSSLEILEMSDVRQVPNLPSNLRKLEIFNRSSPNDFPELPSSLKHLAIGGCYGLENHILREPNEYSSSFF